MSFEKDQDRKPLPGETVAYVKWMRGNRQMSRFMRAAGLGIERIGINETIRLTYNAGEVVTPERVMTAVQKLIDELDRIQHEVELSNPELISIQTIVA